jgi:hypothetical protein
MIGAILNFVLFCCCSDGGSRTNVTLGSNPALFIRARAGRALVLLPKVSAGTLPPPPLPLLLLMLAADACW